MSVIKTATGWRELGSPMVHPMAAIVGDDAPLASHPIDGEVIRQLQPAQEIELEPVVWSFERLLQWNIHLANKVGVQVNEWYGGTVVFGRYSSWTIKAS